VVIGLDGAEGSVVHRLWDEGELPHLKSLAERGTSVTLRTRYGISPVIWTTAVTGLGPREHGIHDFVVSTPRGDVPVSSNLRLAPAIWNLAAAAGRRVAVLGWWVSWPAENLPWGVVVSDRALLPGPGRIAPASLLPRLEREIQVAKASGLAMGDGERDFPRDRLMTHLAEVLLGEDRGDEPFDLTLVYLHGIDTVSHLEWKYYEPKAFPGVSPEEVEHRGDRIPTIYRATDQAIGRIVAAAGAGANIVVLSDHGFHAAEQEQVKVWLDFDRVLEELGYLRRNGEGRVDPGVSRIFTHATPLHQATKKLRLSSGIDRRRVAHDLASDLARLSFDGGAPAFVLRQPEGAEARAGADLVVDVQTLGASERLWLDGRPLSGVIERISRVSGAHGSRTHGILIAAGPDILPGAPLSEPRIQDLMPTWLYVLGLPVAEDLPGRPLLDLLTPEARHRLPLRTIATYGRREPHEAGSPLASEEDQRLVDELRALGYL
jgi:hypothetical protein